MWKENDPRWDINKRAKIVIVDLVLNLTSIAEVETKNAFCVFTNFPEKNFISADDDWPKSWMWCYFPERKINEKV